jgi:3-deoxy-D-manno-octulosonic-acid transferase
MSALYTTVTSLLLVLALPVLPFVVGRTRYRRRLLARLGVGLADRLATPSPPDAGPCFWVHALSVGEVTSALPLVRGLRTRWPQARIVFSATTASGDQVARTLMEPLGATVIAAPLDLGPVAPRFVRLIRPDLFLLVETDFWPNWLHCLRRAGVATLLVNGRVSAPSHARYQRFALFFRPMFRTFSLLAMQTAADADKMIHLGVDPARVVTLGNLKFATAPPLAAPDVDTSRDAARAAWGFAPEAPLWICGSTHPGEEEVIFDVYLRLREQIPSLQLLVAPRRIERRDEILAAARAQGLEFRTRTGDEARQGPLLLLDTIGELAGCSALGDVVFIGGSLVAAGGHNPLEAAAAGVPVLFGPHMEDFAEIAAALMACGGAHQVPAPAALAPAVEQILADPALRRSMAAAAAACVRAHSGVVDRHLEVVARLLATGDGHR